MAATTDSRGDYDASGWNPERLLDTPLGLELREMARRILGPGPAAAEAAGAALVHPPANRVEAISNTVIECRRRDGTVMPLVPPLTASLSAAVAAELAVANARLPTREREVLALRELLRLSYGQMGTVIGHEPRAIALLLARARLNLRELLRGPYRPPGTELVCADTERALELLARRLDSEPFSEAENAWIFGHMADCAACERAHAMMLEASFRYRAWGRP